MLSKHYHLTVNLCIVAVVAFAACADYWPQWKPYFFAGAALAVLPAVVVYFIRQWDLSRET